MRPYEAINSSCFAAALTLVGRDSDVTILAADLLLVDDRLARAVLERTGLDRDQIYFTATHTHSGPGGWGLHPLERLVAGTYRPEVFDYLAGRLAEVVRRSRAGLVPVEVAFVQARVEGMQRNRIAPGPTNDDVSAWIFRSIGGSGRSITLATFATFGAHATITHPVPPRLGGDYPGAFAAELPRLADSGIVLFAAGTVGDAAPARIEAPNQQRAAEAYAHALAVPLAERMAAAEFCREVDFGVIGLDVDMPPVQIPFFSPALRFSPAFSWWVAPRRSYLHAIRLGPATLVGFPGDYAGHLARSLKWATGPVVPTSFNGDYKGYLVSGGLFRAHSCYETRWMNFFGPDSGDYLNELAQGCVTRLAPGGTLTPRGQSRRREASVLDDPGRSL